MSRAARAAAALLLAAASLPPAAARAALPDAVIPGCPAAKVPPLALPRLKEAVAANKEVTIVALGSSSTEGVRSSDIAHSYPAVLQAALTAALTRSHVAVLNRGVGGQDVTEQLPRLERDVLDARPTVVIWQVGANGAMRHMSPDLFRRLLANGVQRLRDAHIDVILMDNQRATQVMASPEHAKFGQAMADVAVATGAGLFGRGALMDQWREGGQPYSMFMSDDGVHHNDLGYSCVARALAAAILEGLGPPANPDASAVASSR